MLKIFQKKFPNIDTGHIIHSLTDFEKADADLDPIVISKITWAEIKERLIKKSKKLGRLCTERSPNCTRIGHIQLIHA